MTFGIESVYFI